MTREQAYALFENIAEMTGTKDRLHLIKATKDEMKEEEEASEIREILINRHHFKDIEFYSSLTNKNYYTKTNEKGTLSIFEKDSNVEIPNNTFLSTSLSFTFFKLNAITIIGTIAINATIISEHINKPFVINPPSILVLYYKKRRI